MPQSTDIIVMESMLIPSESSNAGSRRGEPVVGLGKGKLGQPKWVGSYLVDWEILVYEQANCWEACFFKREAHHEHIKGFSLNNARSKAERKIRSLESAAARSVRPRYGREIPCTEGPTLRAESLRRHNNGHRDNEGLRKPTDGVADVRPVGRL